MTRAVAILFVVWCMGCGAVAHPAQVVREGPPVASVGEASLVFIPAPSDGRTWISLWIDAGAFDAEPSVAVIAAFAATHGAQVNARVLPDGTELAISCESERTEECVEHLTSILSTRHVDEAVLIAARARVRATRRGSRRDPSRTADRLALAALIGGDRGLDPLGDPADDGEVGRAEIEAFLAAHWGPSRALFVAVGDASEVRVRRAIAAALERVPRALQSRAPRSFAPAAGARVEIGDQSLTSAAVAVFDEPTAHAMARRALAALPSGTASVFPFRGVEIVLLHGPGLEDVVRAMVYARAVTMERGGEQALAPDDPRSIAERVGTRWIARGEGGQAGGLGLGVVVDGGRGDSELDAGGEALAREVQVRADAAVASARIEPHIGGTIDERSASLETSEGAKVRARYSPSGRVAIALEIASDARREPARLNGQRALIARLLARCVGDANVEFWAEPTSIGVVLESAPERALDMVEKLTGCVYDLPIGPALIDEVRSRAIAELSADDLRLARVARVLAPAAPGLIAPRGQHESLAAVRAETVRRAWAAMAHENHVSIGIDGDIDAGRAARLAGLGLERLPSGSQTPSDESSIAIAISPDEILSLTSEGDDAAEAIVAMRVPHPVSRGAEAGTRAILASMAETMNVGTRVVWASSGAGAAGAWLAIAVRGSEDDLSGLATRLGRARRRAEAEREHVLALAVERMGHARALLASTARGRARRLATGSDESLDVGASDEIARALLQAPARWVIVRTPPGGRR